MEVVWHAPHPLGASPEATLFTTEVVGPMASLDLSVGAGSLYELRTLQWEGWGTDTATGTGLTRYCSDECSQWQEAKIILGDLITIRCGDDGDVQNYTRYRLRGFENIDGLERESVAACSAL